MTKLNLKDVTILADGLDHPECVAQGPDGNLYAGGEAGQIYRINPSGQVSEIANTGGSVLGICLDGNSNVYACDFKKQAVMRIDRAGAVSVYSDGAPGRKMVQPNFPVFDADGNLFVSDSGGWHENNGCIVRITPKGESRVVTTEAAAFPNGMALGPDGRSLYVVLSNVPGVVKLRLNEDGALEAPQRVVELPGVVPDGLAFDDQGALYISCYTPDVIYQLSPYGELRVLVQDAERTTIASPTNIAFAGPNLSTLVVANYGAWHVARVESRVCGMALHYPLIS